MTRKQFKIDLSAEKNVVAIDEGFSFTSSTFNGKCDVIYRDLSEYPSGPVFVVFEENVVIKNTTFSYGTVHDMIQKIEQEVKNSLIQNVTVIHETDFGFFTYITIPLYDLNFKKEVYSYLKVMRHEQLLVCIECCKSGKIRFSFEVTSSMFKPTKDYIISAFNVVSPRPKRRFSLSWTLNDYLSRHNYSTINGTQLKDDIIRRLDSISTTCLVCHSTFSEKVSLIPTICDQELCQFQFLEYGLGLCVEEEIIQNPALVDLLIQFTFFGASSKLDPFPYAVRHFNQRLENEKDVINLIQLIPSVSCMRRYANEAILKKTLDSIHILIYPFLSWVISSNFNFIEELTDPHEMLAGVPAVGFKQFRFTSGSLNKENVLQRHKQKYATGKESLYAFHGTRKQNWHSILRIGLHYKKKTNGRAYGNGIYHAYNASYSWHYTNGDNSPSWKNADVSIQACICLNEIVNCPKQFVSQSPHIVISDVEWVQLRYIIVKTTAKASVGTQFFDKKLTLKWGNVEVKLPNSENEVKQSLPVYSTFSATKILQRELIQLSQTSNPNIVFDPENVVNLYSWRILLKDFETTLPIAKDLFEARMSGVELEINFHGDYPLTPPFVRIVRPRFCMFSEGGGGNITAGGSICTDMLTSTAWNSVYSVESIVIQIFLLLSDSEQPARLSTYKQDYTLAEAWQAYARVAKAHGWKLPTNKPQFL